MKPEEIKNLICDLQDLHNRLVANYNDNVPFKQLEEDRLAVSNTLDLINQYEAKNEELAYKLGCLLCYATGGKLSKHTYPIEIMESYVNDTTQDYCEEAKAEAIKEFAERLKGKYIGITTHYNLKNDIDNLLKEMGVTNDEKNN